MLSLRHNSILWSQLYPSTLMIIISYHPRTSFVLYVCVLYKITGPCSEKIPQEYKTLILYWNQYQKNRRGWGGKSNYVMMLFYPCEILEIVLVHLTNAIYLFSLFFIRLYVKSDFYFIFKTQKFFSRHFLLRRHHFHIKGA